MKICRFLVLATLMTVSSIAFSAGWSGNKEIEKLNVGGNAKHGLYVKLKDYDFPGCTSALAYLDAITNPNYKEIMSVLLAVKMSKSTVNIRVNGCIGNYPSIEEVQLEQ